MKLLLTVGLLAIMVLACNDNTIEQGGLDQPCFPDGSCTESLRCNENNICEIARGKLNEPCHQDGSCEESLVCREELCLPELAPPSGLIAIGQDYAIVLSWEHPGGDDVDFEVMRREKSESQLKTLAPSTGGRRGFLDQGILLGKTYQYEVKAHWNAEVSKPSELVEGSALQQPKDWTLVYLISSDGNYVGYTYWFNIEQMQAQGGSSDRVNVLALYDGYEPGDSQYLYIGDSDDSTQSFSITTAPDGEVNMGEVGFYEDFIDWMLPRYTARHYLISFHDHGGGAVKSGLVPVDDLPVTPQESNGGVQFELYNMLYDETSGDSLSPDEQAQVVAYLASQTGQQVAMVESMTCLGQMIENTFGMAEHAKYHIGAESLSYVTGTFPIEYLSENPEASDEDVALYMVGHHHEQVVSRDVPCQWSLLDLDSLGELSELITDLGGELYSFAAGGDKQALLRDVVGRAQNFTLYGNDFMASYVDIKNMASELQAEPGLPQSVRERAQSVIELFDNGLIVFNGIHNAYHHGTDIWADYTRAYGLSVYHPNANYPYYEDTADPAYESLSFAKATGWADYLQQISLPKPEGQCPPVEDLQAERLPDGRVRIKWSYASENYNIYDAFWCSRDLDSQWTGIYYTINKSPGRTDFEVFDQPDQPGLYTYRVTAFRPADPDESVNWLRSNEVRIE